MSKVNHLEQVKEQLIADFTGVINKYSLDVVANVPDHILAEWMLNLFTMTFILIDSDRKWHTDPGDLSCGILYQDDDTVQLSQLEDLVSMVLPVNVPNLDLSSLNDVEKNDVFDWASVEYRYVNDEIIDRLPMPECLSNLLWGNSDRTDS